ncbi:MAG: sodium:proton antiporter [Myxococcota bacterium]|nr:sodium:proton antiporter [Myxococcota bacterium]
MSSSGLPLWSMVPFPVLVLAIAVLPIVAPRAWERRFVQCLVVGACAVPVLVELALASRVHEIAEAVTSYLSFVTTLAALYVTSSGVRLTGDIEATPAMNVGLILVGSVLASFVGTTGASMLMIRPVLWTNRQRAHTAHLVPLFIVAVANAGGLLTPLGDPPLLVGYIGGVPFLWTLRLFPAWILYVGSAALALYVIDRRAYARESAQALARDRAQVVPLRIEGKRNVALMLAVVPAALLPMGFREAAMVVITLTSFALSRKTLHTTIGFSLGPIIDVAILFAGLFACLGPIAGSLARAAPWLPLHSAWQLFWASGLLSAVLDNAPTYTAFAALARGLSNPGTGALVAGIAPFKLAAVSIGSVVMGATTYIGNGPNLMIKAIAERERFATPSFFRYALFAFAVMAPAHIVTTMALAYFDR